LAGVAALIAVRTLRAIEGQTRATLIGLKVARVSANAAKKSADIAEQSLAVVNRPQLVFESPELNNFAPMSISGTVKLITVNFTFHNYGEGAAWIIEQAVRFRAETRLADSPEYGTPRTMIPPQVVPPGKPIYSFRHLEPFGMLEESAFKAITQDLTPTLTIYGYVRFEDLLGQRFKMGFCWLYHPPGGFNTQGYWEPGGPESYTYNKQES